MVGPVFCLSRKGLKLSHQHVGFLVVFDSYGIWHSSQIHFKHSVNSLHMCNVVNIDQKSTANLKKIHADYHNAKSPAVSGWTPLAIKLAPIRQVRQSSTTCCSPIPFMHPDTATPVHAIIQQEQSRLPELRSSALG
jgi:hypothetical protein